MSNPSIRDIAQSNLLRSTAVERDWWTGADILARKNAIEGKIDFTDIETATENAYQQDYTAKINQITSTNYDSLPRAVKTLITENMIAIGELPNPSVYRGIGHEFVANPWGMTKEVFTECDRCDETFMSNEDFDLHKEIDHGDDSGDWNEAEETYTLSMNPDITKSQLQEARRILAETSNDDFHRKVYFNGKDIPQPTGWEPDDVKGTVGYNDDPNEGLYNTKKFKAGNSGDRKALEGFTVQVKDTSGSITWQQNYATKAEAEKARKWHEADHGYAVSIQDEEHLGEAHDLNDQSSDFQFHKSDSSDLLRTDQRHRNADGSPHYSNDWNPNQGDQDKVGRADYRGEAFANEWGYDILDGNFTYRTDLSQDMMKCNHCGVDILNKYYNELGSAVWGDAGEKKAVQHLKDEHGIGESISTETSDGVCIHCGRTTDSHGNPSTDYKGADGKAPKPDHYFEGTDDGVEALTGEVGSWDSWRCHNCGEIIPKEQAGKHRDETGHRDISKFKEGDPNDFITWGEADNYPAKNKNADWDDDFKNLKSDYQGRETDVDYDQSGVSDISMVPTPSATDAPISSLEGVDFSEEAIDYSFYPTKAGEAFVEESDPFIEGYGDDDIESDKQAVEAQIINRKLHGYSVESIAKELSMQYGVEMDEAINKANSIEVSVNDKMSHTFFGKRFNECNEAEISELRLYGGTNDD